MEISQLDKDYIEKEKVKSAKQHKGLSCESFKKGWDACLKFVKKVQTADFFCEQCGKLIGIEETEFDSDGTPFCKKCYEKVFNSDNT